MDTKTALRLLKALADRNRLRAVAALARRPACVCELAAALGLRQPNVSRHLAVLEAAGWVEGRREGKWRVYAVRTEGATAPLTAFVRRLAAADPAFAADARRLAAADRCALSTRQRKAGAAPRRA